jgi:hypothetical protein
MHTAPTARDIKASSSAVLLLLQRCLTDTAGAFVDLLHIIM